MSLLGPYFVSCAVCHLPSHLRERKIQEAWIALFGAINTCVYSSLLLVLSEIIFFFFIQSDAKRLSGGGVVHVDR